ncbi:MAG: Nif3-like dinuclear metal center hexameric protein [Nonlabens sp.]
MQIKQVTDYLEQLAPPYYAEDFDNIGLLTGNTSDSVKGILVTLDCLENVVDEAIEKNCNLIVTFHPIIFKGLKHLRPTDYVRKTVVKAIKNDIAIYAIHTNLDLIKGGVSYRMAQELALKNVLTLVPKKGILKKLTTYVPTQNLDEVKAALFEVGAGALGNYSECSFVSEGYGSFQGNSESNPTIGERETTETVRENQIQMTFLPHLEYKVIAALHLSHPYEEVAYEITTLDNVYQNIGLGVVGELEEPLEKEAFLSKLKSAFGCGLVRTSLSRKREIKKVALLGGSGAFAINNAIAAGADAYVTADLKYHDFFQGTETLLCDVGHYESEQFTKTLLYEYLSDKFSSFAILCAQAQTNPVNYYS